MIRQVKKVHAQ